MSYCVNCGVELDASAKKCPLCDTPVYNPKAPEPEKQPSPFPLEKGQVEVVKKKRSGSTVDGYCTGYGGDLWAVKRFCVPQQSVVSGGDRRSPGIVGYYDSCGYLYETAHLSVDPAGWSGSDRVSISADLSDGT